MTKRNQTIPTQVAFPGQDFLKLKDTAREILSDLTGDNWTDYNSHDPGITILEACIYALTEIALRSDIDIQDVISRPEGIQRDLFPAEEILPAAPLTLLDYRKFIIDHPQVRNAWIFPDNSPEIPIYFNHETDVIALAAPELLPVKGLYNLILELETPPDMQQFWGDINQGRLPLILNAGTSQLRAEISFPFWDDTGLPEVWRQPLAFPTNSIKILEAGSLPETDLEDFIVRVKVQDGTPYIFGLKIKITLLSGDLPLISDIITAVAHELNQSEIWEIFNAKIIYAHSIVQNIRNDLLFVRNLGEDFIRFQAARVQEISINAKIILTSDANVNETLARLFLRLEQFIENPISVSDLPSLLVEAKAVHEIFEGPLLENGFILPEALHDNFKNNILYVSDLIKEMFLINNSSIQSYTDLSGKEKQLVAIQNLTLTNFINNQIVNDGIANCLQLFQTEIYKPRFSPEKSKIQVVIGDFSFEPDIIVIIELLEEIRAENLAIQKAKSKQNKLEFPRGNIFDFAKYHSIQHDFPIIFGLGNGHLSSDANKERKARAAQLKAYLLILEQLMADAAAQLNRAKDYFSFSTAIDSTYASQIPASIPGLQTIISGTYDSDMEIRAVRESRNAQRSLKRLHHLSARLGEDLREPSRWMLTNGQRDKWEDDQQALLAGYPSISRQRGLAYHYLGGNPFEPFRIIEDSAGHFHWELSDYEGSILLQSIAPLMSREAAQTQILNVRRLAINPDNYQMTKPDPAIDELRLELNDAPSGGALVAVSIIRFLSNQSLPVPWQPPWSLLRSHIRHTVIGVWHTTNLCGYEKRVSALLGLNNRVRRNLTNGIEKYFLIPIVAPFDVTLINYSGEVLLKSTPTVLISDKAAALNLSETVIQYGLDPVNFVVLANAMSPGFILRLNSPLITLMESVRIFPDEDSALKFRDRVIAFLQAAYGGEGFHVVEHVLLRPRDNASDSALLQIKKNNGGIISAGEKNPYQARLSIIVPNWNGRFARGAFQAILNKYLLQEAPAHIMVDLYRLDKLQMAKFENTYLPWIEIFASEKPGSIAYRNALTLFVQELDTIRLSL